MDNHPNVFLTILINLHVQNKIFVSFRRSSNQIICIFLLNVLYALIILINPNPLFFKNIPSNIFLSFLKFNAYLIHGYLY